MTIPLTWDTIRSRALAFSIRWKDANNEKSEAQSFVRDFLAIFGIDDAAAVGRFENPALREESRGFMDYFLPKKIAIEMKSKGKDLNEAYKQLKNYIVHLSAEEMPELLMVSDFETIVYYNRTTGKKTQFKTQDLCDYIDHFHVLSGREKIHEFDEQFEVNVRAAEKMANLHDDLERHGYEGHNLEIYLVRLLFCLFADDTGIFPKDSFLSYVKNSKEDGSDLSGRIVRLFEILNVSDETRAKRTLLSPELREFRYINGRLFEAQLPSADFDAKMRLTLIDCCKFDWGKISPAIFGAMFQGVMDKNIRRALGAHYTSEDNILRVVNPLFLDELWAKLKRVKVDDRRLDNFHNEIAKLKFLDPACGCGNFLMIAYRELRRLEIEILRIKKRRQKVLDISVLLKVTIEQFYGIEIEDFPCEVARVSLWLMDHLMNLQASKELGQYFVRLPLTKEDATIVHGNALRIDWENIVPKEELSYILGNPPYGGRRYRTKDQIEEVALYFSYKDIDYVACWFKRAAQYIQGTNIECAFVSTNSITQGEQVSALWEELQYQYGIKINWAYHTFKWTNEAKGKAAVHCVIICFSTHDRKEKRLFYDNAGDVKSMAVHHINGYLCDAPDVFIKTRSRPLCDAPLMKNGNVPLDGDALKIEECDYEEFKDCKYIKRLLGGQELLHNEKRYVLWLIGASPTELQRMPQVMRRIEMCRKARLAMKDEGTRKLAETPAFFRDTNNPDTYIALPMVSSERRKYIPMAYLDGNTIPTNQVQTIPNATLYHFGILTSSVHMAWTRAVCGRLEMRYRYSKDIVYNNFPWAVATDEQKATIEKLAQSVLDARAKFPNSSLADLYDPLTMPPVLLKAHQALDRAVMKLYKFKQDMSEPAIVAALMEMYQKLTEKPTMIPAEETKKQWKKRNKM